MYPKMEPAAFAAKLQSGGYDSRTGARKAIGKVSWSQKEKDAAHALINKTFGDGDAPAKAAKSKKIAKPAKHTPRVTLMKDDSPKVAKTAKPAKRAYTKRAYTVGKVSSPEAPTSHEQLVSEAVAKPVTFGGSSASDDRFHSAGNILVALTKREAPRTEAEQQAYDVALAEAITHESPEARAKRLSWAADKPAKGSVARPHIAVPTTPSLTATSPAPSIQMTPVFPTVEDKAEAGSSAPATQEEIEAAEAALSESDRETLAVMRATAANGLQV
jgi:hypothetical protein